MPTIYEVSGNFLRLDYNKSWYFKIENAISKNEKDPSEKYKQPIKYYKKGQYGYRVESTEKIRPKS